MLTPQTNATLPQIARELAAHESFVICGHVNPDGDCLGSQLALASALRSLGKKAICVLAQPGSVGESFAFLPRVGDMVPASSYAGDVDVFVAVDVPTLERMGDAAPLHARASLSVTIDHHASSAAVSALNYIDPDAASTTMLIWELAGYMVSSRSAELALCAYTGLVSDTGRFQYQNATSDAFSAASEMIGAGADAAFVSRQIYQNRSYPSILLEARAIERIRFLRAGQVALSWVSQSDFSECKAQKSDAEPLVDILRSLSGVRVACMLREETGCVRGSLRAKDKTDVAAIAREFGGGGHVAAAGFTFEGSLERALACVPQLIDEHMGSKDGVRP